MSFEMRSTNDLVRILLAGGGITLNGRMRLTDDLVRMALASKQSGAYLKITGMNMRTVDDLVRIAMAGKGHVEFAD